MIDNKYEYFTDMLDDDDEQEYLQEDANPAGLPNYIKNLFGHILKFLFQSEHQSKRWVITARDNVGKIRSVVTNINIYRTITSNLLDKQFKKGIVDVYNTDAKKAGLPLLDENIERYSDWGAKFVLNIDNVVEDTLYASAMTHEMRRFVEDEFKKFHDYNPDFIQKI